MAKQVFEILVLKDCTYECIVHVEASSEKEAVDKAASEANSSEHTVWVEDITLREFYGRSITLN